MRSWEDLAPWIRLTRVLRLLASPIHIGLVAIAWGLTLQMIAYAVEGELPVPKLVQWQTPLEFLTRLVRSSGGGPTSLLLGLILLVWTPVIQFSARAGAALTAGKPLPVHKATRQLVQSRIWKSYLVPIVPCLCILAFAVLVFLVRVPSLVVDVPAISMVTGWLIGIGSIPIGVLGFGALFAIPLGLVAMASEPDPDPIDSLSRGYEYLYRRPLAVIWYLIVCAALIYLTSVLVGGIVAAASLAASAIVLSIAGNEAQLFAAENALEIIFNAWIMTFAFGLLGGVYLLLRGDAGGQDIDDFWTPPGPPAKPLPELPQQAYQS